MRKLTLWHLWDVKIHNTKKASDCANCRQNNLLLSLCSQSTFSLLASPVLGCTSPKPLAKPVCLNWNQFRPIDNKPILILVLILTSPEYYGAIIMWHDPTALKFHLQEVIPWIRSVVWEVTTSTAWHTWLLSIDITGVQSNPTTWNWHLWLFGNVLIGF